MAHVLFLGGKWHGRVVDMPEPLPPRWMVAETASNPWVLTQLDSVDYAPEPVMWEYELVRLRYDDPAAPVLLVYRTIGRSIDDPNTQRMLTDFAMGREPGPHPREH